MDNKDFMSIAEDATGYLPDVSEKAAYPVVIMEQQESYSDRLANFMASASSFHPWDQSEDALLQAHYASGESIAQIADSHQRPVEEIKARMIQLRVMPNFYAPTSSTQTRSRSRKKENEKAASEPVKVNKPVEVSHPTTARPNLPSNAGKKWNAEQENALRDSFTAGMSIPALAQHYGRTPGSISSRLFRLGLIDDPFAHGAAKETDSGTPQTTDFEFPF